MSQSEEITLGEVARKLDSLAGDVKDLAGKVDDRPSWRDIQRVENGLMHRVKELEDWQKWAQRLAIGAIVSGIIAAYFIIKP